MIWRFGLAKLVSLAHYYSETSPIRIVPFLGFHQDRNLSLEKVWTFVLLFGVSTLWRQQTITESFNHTQYQTDFRIKISNWTDLKPITENFLRFCSKLWKSNPQISIGVLSDHIDNKSKYFMTKIQSALGRLGLLVNLSLEYFENDFNDNKQIMEATIYVISQFETLCKTLPPWPACSH